MTKNCILVDLDGTLADCSHRRHHVEKTPKDWDAFFQPQLVAQDKLVEVVSDTVVGLADIGYHVVYVSARREELRQTTIDWLSKHGMWFQTNLYMRKLDDRRQDVLVKKDLLAKIRADGFNPVLALDDRSTVVAMWREEGIPCFQVAAGEF